MPIRKAEAEWKGNLAEGSGRLKVGSGDMYQLQQQQISLTSARMYLLRLQNERLIQRVNLHLALGGIYKS